MITAPTSARWLRLCKLAEPLKGLFMPNTNGATGSRWLVDLATEGEDLLLDLQLQLRTAGGEVELGDVDPDRVGA